MEIKYLKLKQVSKFRLGLNIDKVILGGTKKLIRIGNISNGKINQDDLIFFQEKEPYQDLNKYLIKKDDIVIATRGEGVGKVAIGDDNEEIFFNSNICLIDTDKSLIFNRYLYHYLLEKQSLIKALSHKTAVKMLNSERLKEMIIPIPPLEKQQSIANKLENLLELSEELGEELNLRKSQYEYYRDELLAFKQDNKIKWLTLGKISNESYGGGFFSKNSILDLGDPCIRYAQLYEEDRLHFDYCTLFTDKSKIQSPKYCQYGDLLMARVGIIKKDIAKSCVYLGKESALIDDKIIGIKHNQNPKYLAYALSTTNAQKQKIKLSKASGICTITFDSIEKIKIPIPSLEKQEKIANLLDKFWKLSIDIKDGLPGEIFLRKQQYEYYRGILVK